MSTVNPHLDSTIQSLEHGLEKARSGASSSVTSWAETLQESEDESLQHLATELEDFAELIENEDASAEEIKTALHSLGKHTMNAGKKAEGVTAQQLKELSKQLTDGADSL